MLCVAARAGLCASPRARAAGPEDLRAGRGSRGPTDSE